VRDFLRGSSCFFFFSFPRPFSAITFPPIFLPKFGWSLLSNSWPPSLRRWLGSLGQNGGFSRSPEYLLFYPFLESTSSELVLFLLSSFPFLDAVVIIPSFLQIPLRPSLSLYKTPDIFSCLISERSGFRTMVVMSGPPILPAHS